MFNKMVKGFYALQDLLNLKKSAKEVRTGHGRCPRWQGGRDSVGGEEERGKCAQPKLYVLLKYLFGKTLELGSNLADFERGAKFLARFTEKIF